MINRQRCKYIFVIMAAALSLNAAGSLIKLNNLRSIINDLQSKNNSLKMQVSNMEYAQEKFFSALKSEVFEVTAYDHSTASCGKWSAFKRTKSGTTPNSLRTVSVDPEIIPIGSLIYIEGIGWRVAEDTGRLIKGRAIDVYFDKVKDAHEFGRQKLRVYYNDRIENISS